MKILHISDTHGEHHKILGLPEADVLVHSGDCTLHSTEQEVLDFLRWFGSLPFKHKIFIGGNHDDILYGASIEGLDANVHYLCNSGIVIKGIKFYGVPMFTYDCLTGQDERNYANIPPDTDVLITHCPAYGILDLDDGVHYGSQALLSKISSLNLKAHLFGHIHSQAGMLNINDTIFSNGSMTSSLNLLTI